MAPCRHVPWNFMQYVISIDQVINYNGKYIASCIDNDSALPACPVVYSCNTRKLSKYANMNMSINKIQILAVLL